ncbi:porin family protein [Spirosoma linguale]|uniref:Outer membrane protein beta-barrel domain-containing protein n=1 Tax=Spirosoma linguale (strain ATCC 33905 / DSM 74 / LMG 10896 / Claus 1) TaxID=504472 RepID=D2QEY6_SPILD|nr:hypothetical protein Slin_5362 [Spirosoma linguale DSM 74]
MKKSTVLLIGLLFSTYAVFAQVRLGLTAGFQLASEQYKIGGLTLKTNNYPGYMGGLVVDAIMTEKLSIRSQALYSVKGAKLDLGSLSGGLSIGSVSTIFNYIEVPVQLTYSLDAGPGWVVLGAGPYVAYALNAKSTGTNLGQQLNEAVEFSSKDGDAKRLDYGLRLSVGYELPSGLMVSGYYSPGLANIVSGPSSAIKNTAMGLSLGFMFGGN